jgi:ATP/maltotriose-dependent transcriptional regulator MalT
VLADHFEKGQKPERAVRWLRVAANQAMEVDDLKAALDRVERGVRLGAQGDDLAELRVVEAEARYWKGEYVEAERAAREGRKGEDARLVLRATSALVVALGPQAKYEEIGQLSKDFQERPAQLELLNPWLECQYSFAAFLAAAGQFEARERILVMLEAERDRLDPILVGRIESMRSHVARADGKLVESVACMRRSWEHFERAGHLRAGTEALGNSGMALMELGQLEEAESQIRRLSSIAERMGLNHLTGATLYMLSNILAYRGVLDEARVFGERALAWTAENNDQHFHRFALLYLSVAEHLAENYALAERHARRALAMLENSPSLRPFALALLARALMGQGLVEEAKSLGLRAYDELVALGEVLDGEAIIRLAHAECLAASHEPELAGAVLRSAAEWLGKRANAIANPDWRKDFLNRIPEHCRILKLAQEIGIPIDDLLVN